MKSLREKGGKCKRMKKRERKRKKAERKEKKGNKRVK